MISFYQHYQSLFPYILAFWLTAAGLFFPPVMHADEHQSMAEHSISITFDLEQAKLTGTSKIILPPATPMVLHCGPLTITGAVLDIMGLSQLTLVPGDDNTIRVPSSDKQQIIYVSWDLAATNPYRSGNLIGREGITLAGFWHPIPDIDMHYKLEAELPGDFTGISEGETVTYCKDRYNKRYLTTAFEHPVNSIHFAAGPYTVKYKKIQNGIELAAFFFQEDIELADEYLEKAAGYIARYENLIGPFPYSRYSIVENRLPTGYGMPTMTLLGQAVVRLPFIKDTSLGHEILHSWFGNSVYLDSSGGNWIEGLTTYLADQLYAQDQGKGSEYRKNQLLRYISYVHENNGMSLQDFTNASDSQPMARKVRAIGYDKGSMVFHMLRMRLGDEAFYGGIATFYEQMKFKRADWEDLEKAFAETTDDDLDDFFDQWLTRWDLPRFTFSSLNIDQIDGKSKISFKVEQKTVEPYLLRLPIVIETLNGTYRKTIELEERQSDVAVTVDELPVKMFVDPEYDVMRDLNSDEVPPIWSFFMGAENKIAVLASEEEKQIYEPLLSYLESINSEVVTADELDNSDLLDGSFLFLGPSKHSRGLFADPGHPEAGFTLDVRQNPLNHHGVMVLVTSSSRQETAGVRRKLSHYGKYSYLHFLDGKLNESSIAHTANGLTINLFTEPKVLPVQEIKSFDDIVDSLKEKRVVYVGEMHTDMGSHILQLQVIQALYRDNPNLVIGMEMFPRSSQQALDEYIQGTITTEREFLKKSNYFKVWGFDYRYYKEIIDFARLNKIPILALNIDKAIVSTVFREGLDTLEENQIEQIPAERDLDVPGYSERLSRAFASHDSNAFNPEKMGGFLQAQSIWDEAMADNIAGYLTENPDKSMVVIAGNGHVYKDSAIPLRVKRRLDVPQSVLVSINHESTGLQTGSKVDYLVYNASFELQPSPKVGVILQEEKAEETSGETQVRVVRISPHGKAGDAGVKADDIILSVEGEKITEITDLKISLLDNKPGDKVPMKLLRKGIFGDKEVEVEVELSSPMEMQGNKPPNHP